RYHDSSSNIIFHQKIPKQQIIPSPLSTNIQPINSPSSSVRRVHSTNDSDDDFHQIINKKKKKRKQKQAAPSHLQHPNVNVNVNPTPSNITSSHPTSSFSPGHQNVYAVNNVTQQYLHQQQSVPTKESTRYALTRFPFP